MSTEELREFLAKNDPDLLTLIDTTQQKISDVNPMRAINVDGVMRIFGGPK